MTRSHTGSLLLICLLRLAGCDAMRHDEPQRWRFAIEESIGSVQHEYAMEFKRRVEAASEGRIEVVVYPYGALGTSTQMTEQLNLGALEFAMCSPGSIGKFIPETQVFLLHFVLSEDDAVNQRVLSSPRILEAFDALYAKRGLKLLSIFPEGEMVWSTNKQIRRPGDFRGVKMRVMTSPIIIAAYDAYGASATPLPYSEVYSALQLGMIDAQVNPIFAIERQRFYEVTDWLIFPGHAQFVTTAAANKDFYDALPESDRRLVDSIIGGLNSYIFDKQKAFQTTRLKGILEDRLNKQKTITVCADLSNFTETLSAEDRSRLIANNSYLTVTEPLSSAERDAFVKASKPVRETYLRIGGPGAQRMLALLLDAVRSAEQP